MQTVINLAVAICVIMYTGYKYSYRNLHRFVVGKHILWIWPVQCLIKHCADHPRGRPRGIDTVASI